eukprot:5650815-Ditylum_brightwellii.AAC.1
MHKYQVDIWGWTETNINWMPAMTTKATQMGLKTCWNFKLVMPCSDDPTEHKQQGGTYMVLVNNMVGRHVQSREDTSGPG